MKLKEIVDREIMEYLEDSLTQAKEFLEHDVAHLTGFKDNNDEEGIQMMEKMVQDSREAVVEYEQAPKSPNEWLASQCEVAYILKNWSSHCGPWDFDRTSWQYLEFVKQMRLCARLIFQIAGLWEPLPFERRKLFSSFIDAHLHEHLQGMHDEIMKTKSVMGAVYTLLGKMWDDFHNERGKPFLESRKILLGRSLVEQGLIDTILHHTIV